MSLGAAVVAMLAAVPAAVAGDDEALNALGDGSGYTNEDLLRDPTTGCENCAPQPPHEWDDPWFDFDWSLALRGAYVHATGGDYLEGTAIPSVSLSHETLRGGYDFSASAEIHASTLEPVRVGAVRAGFSGEYQLEEDMAVRGNLDLALTRASARAPGVMPTILEQPLVFSGNGDASIERSFGPFVFTATGDASRTIYGPTTMVGPVLVDNTHQSNWVLGGALRAGYRVTPLLTAFIDGRVARQWYDAVSPVYLVKLDATDYEARTGLSYDWNDILEGEASVGVGLRRFDAAVLGEVASLLYDASVTFRPDETLEMRGAFATNFGAPGANSGGTVRLEYIATGDIRYKVNPWLTLRANAGWRHAILIGTPDTDSGYNAGIGADYLLNEFTTLTADYGYSYGVATPNPPADEHRVTLGITFHD